jgi:hypothetical protein
MQFLASLFGILHHFEHDIRSAFGIRMDSLTNLAAEKSAMLLIFSYCYCRPVTHRIGPYWPKSSNRSSAEALYLRLGQLFRSARTLFLSNVIAQNNIR